MKNKKSDSEFSYADLPLGLSAALAQNVSAMSAFAQMSSQDQQSFINGAHGIRSKAEMREYVSKLSK